MKLMENEILLNNSRNQQYFDVFISEFAFPHAILQSAPLSHEVKSLLTDELDNIRLLLETEEKWDFFKQLQNSAPFQIIYLSIRVLTCNITKRTVVR